MKQFALLAAFIGLLWPGFAIAGPLETFSGLILPDRPETSFFLLLKEPKKLLFQVNDSKGNPLPEVKITELTLTSNTAISVKNPQGLVTADLSEAGIYEIKIQATRKTGPQIGFNLKIFDQGPPSLGASGKPAVGSTTFQAPPPVETDHPPIMGIDQNKPASNAVFPPLITPASIPLSAPATPAVPLPHAKKDPVASATPPIASKSNAIGSEPLKLPKTPQKTPDQPGLATEPQTNQVPKKPDQPLPASSAASAPAKEFSVTERFQQGPGFADPFRPVEIRFNQDLPPDAQIEKIVSVSFLDSSGKESPVTGQAYPIGKNGIGFASSKLEPGTVFYVSVSSPVSLKLLEKFKFQTLPETKIDLSEDNQDIILSLDWKSKPHLIPTEESQVVRLTNASLKLFSSGIEIFSFPLTSELAPSGSFEDVNYSSRPFHFDLRVPKTKIPHVADEVSAALQVAICGKPQPVEVGRAKLKLPPIASSTQIVATPINTASPTHQPQNPLVATAVSAPVINPLATHVVTLIATPAVSPIATHVSTNVATSTPIGTASKTRAIFLSPVISCEDPGPLILVEWKQKFAAYENEPSKNISWPKGLKWNTDGSLWVADSQGRRILSFDNKGNLITAFGKKGKGTGALGMPIDLAINGPAVFVSDPSAHNVHVFGQSGAPVRDIGTWGVKPGQLDLPHGIEIASDQIWIADRGNCRISRFGLDGSYRGGFGEKGDAQGFLNQPIAIRLHGDKLWVLDCEPVRLQKFGLDGKFLGRISLGTIKEASAMDIDPWGYIWIVDGEGHQVIRLDATGKQLMSIPVSGEPEPTNLELVEASEPEKKNWTPTAIAVRGDGVVAIADGVSKSIHLYKIRKM